MQHVQQIPAQHGMQQPLISQQAMQMQTMQNQQISQQTIMQMGQAQVQQQTRPNNPQGILSGQQFVQSGGGSQTQPGMGGPMLMNYQGQGNSNVSQQQPRNPMGQFTSRDGAINIDYQQGARGTRQPIHLVQHSQMQTSINRSGQKGGHLHMGSHTTSGEQQLESQQIGSHTMGTQPMPHHIGQTPMSGQQYYMQQDHRWD
ncbi:hypothetical protein DICVIV_13439 [Dictyocaulus viviparus]|uniref:Uncharacterized protein n=1 Tax=Dictyocaulus viviparus TaxID=29172 RepID=A0A0D8XAD4_DICVI|nr:hypothetical protein DICVIV_13439 [Dictyocaulus viviparus]